MKKSLNEANVDRLRSEITRLGYVEKTGQLSEAGDLNANFVELIIRFINDWKSISQCPLRFTAGNDNLHKDKKSFHAQGLAVDVTLDKVCHSEFIRLLEKYKSYYKGFSYLDEYTNPSRYATGPHFHISYNQGGQPETAAKKQTPSSGTTVSGQTVTGDETIPSDLGIDDTSDLASFYGAIAKPIAGALAKNMVTQSVKEEITRIKNLMIL
jgi:hypothetical protein